MSVRPDQQRHAAVRRLLEDDVRDSPAELLAILNAVSDGIIAQDPTGAAVYANDAAARLCGFGSAEALALYRLNALDATVKGALEHGLG